jgi:hypothetical protein
MTDESKGKEMDMPSSVGRLQQFIGRAHEIEVLKKAFFLDKAKLVHCQLLN